MTPQSSFMVVAPIRSAQEGELRALLAGMNEAPGRVKADNPVIPFSQLETLHMARLLILDDQTTNDVEAYGQRPDVYPLSLAFLGDIDEPEDDFLKKLAARASAGLRRLFTCCEDFGPETDLVAWMRRHRSPSVANYVNCRGRTVCRIREEATLYEALQQHLATSEEALADLTPREIHRRLALAMGEAIAGARLTLTPESPTPPAWQICNTLHLIGMPLLLLASLPLLLLVAPFYLWRLRILEKSDPELCDPVAQAWTEYLSQGEDHDVTNQFSAVGTLKPGLVRLITILGVLLTVDYAARHLTPPGRLGRIRTIHFARWAFLDGGRRMIFCSNYDGSVESYMDDFINKTGFGLNASFSNGIGYPRVDWLITGGCADERKYKEFLRRHTLPTQVWYKAYPGLTAIDLERHRKVREGLESETLTDEEIAAWLSLL